MNEMNNESINLMQTAEKLTSAFIDEEATAADMTYHPTAAKHLPPITDKTTLGELLKMLDLTPGQKKPAKTPTPKKLRTTVGLIAQTKTIMLYRNGFAYYNNGSNHSVLWLPYCVSFTYHFNPLKDSEKNTLKETDTLKAGLLEDNPWVTATTLIAEHRIEHHMDTNAGIGHSDIPDYADGEDEISMDAYVGKDNRCMEFMWHEEPINVNPLDAVCRKETKEEILADLTDKQIEVLVLHYRDGYTQREIAERLNIDQTTVRDRMRCAMKKIKNILSDTP
jgi:RNA polymerase sigma factor (sigma-70 family)